MVARLGDTAGNVRRIIIQPAIVPASCLPPVVGRGFAHIEFRSAEAATQALINGMEIDADGRPLLLDYGAPVLDSDGNITALARDAEWGGFIVIKGGEKFPRWRSVWAFIRPGGVLEVFRTPHDCQGADGADGADGGDGANGSDGGEAAGAVGERAAASAAGEGEGKGGGGETKGGGADAEENAEGKGSPLLRIDSNVSSAHLRIYLGQGAATFTDQGPLGLEIFDIARDGVRWALRFPDMEAANEWRSVITRFGHSQSRLSVTRAQAAAAADAAIAAELPAVEAVDVANPVFAVGPVFTGGSLSGIGGGGGAGSTYAGVQTQDRKGGRAVSRNSSWKQVLDPTTNACYYHNEDTDETSWDAPPTFVPCAKAGGGGRSPGGIMLAWEENESSVSSLAWTSSHDVSDESYSCSSVATASVRDEGRDGVRDAAGLHAGPLVRGHGVFKCDGCMEEKKLSSMMSVEGGECGHWNCPACIREVLVAGIQDESIKLDAVSCPGVGCGSLISVEDARRSLSREEFDNYLKERLTELLEGSDQYIRCVPLNVNAERTRRSGCLDGRMNE